jgi:hypothetical protein
MMRKKFIHCSLKNIRGNKNINTKFYIQGIITPYKLTNPSYTYMDTTSTKQQHPYPPPKYLEFTKIRSERRKDIKFIINSQSKIIIALG